MKLKMKSASNSNRPSKMTPLLSLNPPVLNFYFFFEIQTQVFAEFVATRLASSNHRHEPSDGSPQVVSQCRLKRPVKFKSTKAEKHRKRVRLDGSENDTSRKPVVSDEETQMWVCCNVSYHEPLEIHKHVAKYHQDEIDVLTESRLDDQTPGDEALSSGEGVDETR